MVIKAIQADTRRNELRSTHKIDTKGLLGKYERSIKEKD